MAKKKMAGKNVLSCFVLNCSPLLKMLAWQDLLPQILIYSPACSLNILSKISDSELSICGRDSLMDDWMSQHQHQHHYAITLLLPLPVVYGPHARHSSQVANHARLSLATLSPLLGAVQLKRYQYSKNFFQLFAIF